MNAQNIIEYLREEAEHDWHPSLEAMDVFTLLAHIDQQQAEIELLKADAARYQWLRDPCAGAERVVMYGRGDFGTGLMSGTMLDETIDAAMKETPCKN